MTVSWQQPCTPLPPHPWYVSIFAFILYFLNQFLIIRQPLDLLPLTKLTSVCTIGRLHIHLWFIMQRFREVTWQSKRYI
jgi:hypothetical protein